MSDGLVELDFILNPHAEGSCKGEVKIMSPGNRAIEMIIEALKEEEPKEPDPLPEGGWSYRVKPQTATLVPTKKLSIWQRIWNWLLSPLWQKK